MRTIWAASLLTFAGCYADAQVRGPSVGVVAEPAPVVVAPAPEPVYVAPPMVEVEPGVQVIEDYDQPVFYSDNLYWRYDGGIWYSSRYHDRGWYRNDRVPERVHHIDHVDTYRHYHSGGGVRVEGRTHAEGGVRVEGRTHEEPVRVEGRTHEEPHGAVRVEGRTHEEPVRVEGRTHEEPHGAVRVEGRTEAHPAPPPAKHETSKHDDKKHK